MAMESFRDLREALFINNLISIDFIKLSLKGLINFKAWIKTYY